MAEVEAFALYLIGLAMDFGIGLGIARSALFYLLFSTENAMFTLFSLFPIFPRLVVSALLFKGLAFLVQVGCRRRRSRG